MAEKLPPSHVVVGSEDNLSRDSEALVERLRAEGVEHEYVVEPGMDHGYVLYEFLPQAREAMRRMIAFLDARFAG